MAGCESDSESSVDMVKSEVSGYAVLLECMRVCMQASNFEQFESLVARMIVVLVLSTQSALAILFQQFVERMSLRNE